MADISNNASDNVAQQAQNQGKELAKKGAKKAEKYAKRGAKKVINKGKKALVKGAKAAGKALANLGKIIVKLIMQLIALLSGPILIAIGVLLVGVLAWNFLAEERGSTESNDLNPAVDNPAIVDTETGITKALALTEPQAVIDAYYKLMSTYSFTKSYKNEDYVFNEPNETQDFAGLRDYFDRENNFYLSDDFIRMMDELLHTNSLYYPEQIIKPVFGKDMKLKDKDGVEGTFYTSRLPIDFKDGDNSRMFDDKIVMNFGDMLEDKTQLNSTIGQDDVETLIAQSQNPTATANADGTTTYALTERNVLSETVPAGAVPGIWDYGFGSVLQYQPEQKESYIECTYTNTQVDIDVRYWVESDDGGYWGAWSHSSIINWPLAGITSVDTLKSQLNTYVSNLSSSTVDYTYHLPTNIAAIVNPSTAWNMVVEPNSAKETTYKNAYGRTVTNNHIDAKIEDAKDADIDRLQFNNSDLTADFGNKGGGLYPLKIAVVSHAATFSGNIHYTVYPTTSDKCDVTTIPLSPNSVADPDHRDPVTVIQVAGSCNDASVTGTRLLNATRTGNLITKTPHVEETASPWGFAYMQDYAEEYVNYAPKEYMEDRDFFVRTGLKAPEGSTQREEYQNNLKFLLDLGLLRPWNGNISLSAVGTVDVADMGSSTSDLYILSHLIAVEAGPNKLDQLMVASVFVNRVSSSKYPNTYWEVLTQPNQYSSYPGMYDKPNKQPTDEMIASAMQVMSGQFTIPENILGQSAHIQGTIYKVVDNGPKYNTHYYCTPGNVMVSTVDRYGRPAPDASQLESMAKKLEGGNPNDISVSGAAFDLSSSCFIGDSLTVGLDTTQGLKAKGATVIAKEGAGLTKIKQLVDGSTIPSTVKTIYLLAGTNSCADYDATFQQNYLNLLSSIGAKAPQARIILTSLPPCVDNAGHNASNAYIKAKNQVINNIASSGGMQILDIWSVLQKDGSLDPGYSADGLHLTAAGYGVWFSKIKGGATVSQIEVSDSAMAFENLGTDGLPIDSDYSLYDISNFDTLTAINMQASIAQADASAKSWLAKLVGGLENVVEDVLGFLVQFWDAITTTVFPSQNSALNQCFYIGTQYYHGDIRGVVYQTITFTTQTWYSTAEEAADEKLANGDITFLFVGKDAVLGLGTVGYGNMQIIPGVATTLDGTISPTSSYYSPLITFDGTKVELNVPENTNVLAVGDGKILETGDDPSNAKGRYVIQEMVANGDTYEITYGYLSSISVSTGATVSKGDLIGLSGARNGGSNALYFQVKKNGTTIDPMSIFYQSTISGTGSLGGNLYNADGTVNKQAVKTLEDQLTKIIGLSGRVTDYYGYSKSMTSSPYHQAPINGLQGLQCTWWAWGRGYEYLCTVKNSHITKAQFGALAQYNGGDYYSGNKSAGLFNYGSMPKPNSLVCYIDAGHAGHVAYVEAVDYVNQKYYESECGAGKNWLGVNERKFGYAPHWHGRQYVLAGFIYLDEPKI